MAAPAYYAAYLRFAEGVARVLQTRIELFVTGHPNVTFRHGLPGGSGWTVQLMSSSGLGDLIGRDIASAGPQIAAHPHMTSTDARDDCTVMQKRLHLNLTYHDVRNNEAEHYACFVPAPHALAWAGAAIRQCQREQAASVFRTQGAPSGVASSPCDSAWHPLFRDLPQVTSRDVDLFEHDVLGYLLRSPPSLSGPYPGSTGASPSPDAATKATATTAAESEDAAVQPADTTSLP